MKYITVPKANEEDIIKQFKDYIVTIKDGAQIIFIDENAGKKLGLFENA